jgi:hypothetical protein
MSRVRESSRDFSPVLQPGNNRFFARFERATEMCIPGSHVRENTENERERGQTATRDIGVDEASGVAAEK